MTVAILFQEVVLMYVSIKSRERRRLLSVSEALGLMINFGTLIIALIALVVTLIKQNKK
ncbi:putative holin-like toxin [Enterococcus faecium]|nr:putative holin-like toxin [Enterococcus faecium]NMO69654.1 putative holin-like toxin [Enterococcus faecium]NTL00558.1 putative holin-like toxin [Enterococcus faecium]NTN37463.1 putative holin-like toxin [Enterococcus faecium]NTN68289.1 putative holin-like toxin [Enterococcus faecium]